MNQVNESVEVLDVVIIGGGLVGGLTALLLTQGGVQATVLDAAPILRSHRTSRLPLLVCMRFQDLFHSP
ncbi:MAG: FAD-dependent oxidoreductase, partial [Acinetobacter sp.]